MRPLGSAISLLLKIPAGCSWWEPRASARRCCLLAKRLRFERARSSFHLLPENDLVDKPVGQVRIFSRPDIDKIMQDEMYWENVWLMSMVLAIHKASGTRVAHLQRPLSTFAEDGNLVTIMDFFPAIIDLSRRDYFRAQRDFHNVLVPSYRRIHTPIAAFVDNVDEYFDAHLTSKERTRGHVGATEKRFWYATQTGLAKAIRSLHGINHHIKIFASIRQEAFQQLLDVDPRAQQFEGSAIRDPIRGARSAEHFHPQSLPGARHESCRTCPRVRFRAVLWLAKLPALACACG